MALTEENAAALKKIEAFAFEMDLAQKKQQKDMFKLKKFFERKLGEKDVFIHQLQDEIEENKQWLTEIAFWKKENEKRVEEKKEEVARMEALFAKKEEGFEHVLTDFKKLQEAKEEMRKHYEETIKKREKESSMNLFKEQEKDLEYDEIKKETMDLLFIKETAYKALAEENAAA